MCIIFFNFARNCCELGSKYRLILAANRDEFFYRPAESAHFWEDSPNVIGGRDKTQNKEGGTWLAMTKNGRIGMLTNYRSKADMEANVGDQSLNSRGHLLVNYLQANIKPSGYIDQVLNGSMKYSPFNLVVGNYSSDSGFSFSYGSNAAQCVDNAYELQPGVHGLCNAEINCAWTKVQEGKKMFSQIIAASKSKDVLIENLFKLMRDDTQYYPNHGGSATDLDEDRAPPLSAIFVHCPKFPYGTRATTIVLVDDNNKVTFIERSMTNPMDTVDPGWQTQKFEFQIEST